MHERVLRSDPFWVRMREKTQDWIVQSVAGLFPFPRLMVWVTAGLSQCSASLRHSVGPDTLLMLLLISASDHNMLDTTCHVSIRDQMIRPTQDCPLCCTGRPFHHHWSQEAILPWHVKHLTWKWTFWTRTTSPLQTSLQRWQRMAEEPGPLPLPPPALLLLL